MSYINKTKFFLFFYLHFVTLVFSQDKENDFELRGAIHGIDAGIIYLSYYNSSQQVGIHDSSLIKDGVFHFAGHVAEPAVAYLSLEKNVAFGVNSTDIFIEPARMSVDVEFNNFETAHVSGSSEHRKYENLLKRRTLLKQKHEQQLNKLSDKYTADDVLIRESLASYYDSLNQIDYDFFEANPTSYLTLYLLQNHLRDLSADSLILFYDRLGNHLQQHIIGKRISEIIYKNKKFKTTVGSTAPLFTGTDSKGRTIESKNYRGKYLLLDFWATWCIPCRKNNPQLIALFRQYEKRGLNILGVADDRDIQKWQDAIVKDGVDLWPQIRRIVDKNKKLNGETDADDINENFGVHELPTLILLDPNGVVIGRFQDNITYLDKVLDKVL